MRSLSLDSKFGGLIAWDSFFLIRLLTTSA